VTACQQTLFPTVGYQWSNGFIDFSNFFASQFSSYIMEIGFFRFGTYGLSLHKGDNMSLITKVIAVLMVLVGAPSVLGDPAFPAKQMTIVVPFPPGGSTDRVTRLIAQKLSDNTGQPTIVQNRPGAAGAVAAQAVLSQPADGYTVFVGHVGTHAIDPHLNVQVGFDANRDFRPVTSFFSFHSILVVPVSLPANNIKELVALAKSRPGGLNFASQGTGTAGHFLGEMFQQVTGAPMVHLPMKGAAQAVTETVAGRIDVLFSSYLSAQAFLKEGRLKALAYAGPKRSAMLPDVPTLAELGILGVEYDQWFGFFVPAKVSDGVVARLNAELVRAARSPEVTGSVGGQDANIVTSTPDEIARQIATEYRRYGEVVKRLGSQVR
jgi:tripartite-type tricarboxylate transporter receptor subunit TctC